MFPLDLYCAVHKENGVQAFTTDLQEARDALGVGSASNRQSIIPMTNTKAGDPHDLDTTWTGGSMWWAGWEDINRMRVSCEAATAGINHF